MPIKIANNASGTLATAISASDTGIVLTTGDGAEFPTLTAGEYFYATLVSSGGTQEIVKTTARSGDSLTIVRAQGGTSAAGFAAGSRFELRVTTQSVVDTVYDITRYQGAATTNPTVRLNGEPLLTGDFYFNSGDNSLRFYNGSSWQSVVSGSISIEQFSGNGSTTVFTFSTAPSVEAVTQVYINGVYQQKDTYTLVGTTLTFSQAPVAGSGNIEVVVIEAIAIGTLASPSVTYSPAVTSLLTAVDVKNALDDLSHESTGSSLVGFLQAGTGATSRTVQSKLRETVSVKDFGAVGDGVADDTAAINAALNSGARRVYFPAGFYKHTGLTISNAQTLIGANNSESAGSVLVCSAAGVDNITIPAAGQVVIENLCIRGNNPGGTASTSGSGIHINTQATPTLRNVFIYNNGEYGIKITGNASRLHVDTCRIQSNTLGGIWGKGVGAAQINAITIDSCAISFNGPFGIDVWGNSVNIENNIIESHDVGVKVSYVGTASVSAIYAYAIKNNYFEAHSTNQILVETTTSQTILGFEITGNYGYQNTSNVAYRHVKFTSSSANEVRSMLYGFNAFFSNISLVTAIVADFGSRLASDCVIYPYFNYSTSSLVLTAPFTNYENLGSAKFEAYKSVICPGITESFAGTGIAYTTLEKSDNITVSGSKIFFAPDVPLGAIPVSLTIGIETNATSYSVAAYIYSRALGSTGSFSTVTASFTMPATSGSTTQTWIFNPLTAVRKTPTVFEYKMEIVVTLTTPGTTFYLGNPSITYIG